MTKVVQSVNPGVFEEHRLSCARELCNSIMRGQTVLLLKEI